MTVFPSRNSLSFNSLAIHIYISSCFAGQSLFLSLRSARGYTKAFHFIFFLRVPPLIIVRLCLRLLVILFSDSLLSSLLSTVLFCSPGRQCVPHHSLCFLLSAALFISGRHTCPLERGRGEVGKGEGGEGRGREAMLSAGGDFTTRVQGPGVARGG